MPRKAKASSVETFEPAQFLRSINVCFDAEFPERIAHYRPTAKGVALLQALLGERAERAYLVLAPYGSGKSLVASYLLHLVENRDESSVALATIQARLKDVDRALHAFAGNRREQGLVLALHGYQENLATGIKEAASASLQRLGINRNVIARMAADTSEDAIRILKKLQEVARERGLDRISVVWDEFGRHLESLLDEGRPSALVEVQQLAEVASRSKDVPMTLGLLLHQGLLQYAGSSPQSVRREWLKVEGRFETFQFLEDSKELYRLIAGIIDSRKSSAQITKTSCRKAARTAKALGLLQEFSQEELTEVLHKAYPLEPVTLYLLPRLAGRVAQNERTLFTFVYSTTAHEPITPGALYGYFVGAMRSDTGVGGTYRQWLETESALAKAKNEDEMAVIKNACLLGLGSSGERGRTSKALLEFAGAGYGASKQARGTVSRLIERKLLLHRKHNDEVAVWHGTDVDLRSRLRDECQRHRPEFDLLRFLENEAHAPIWRPVQYNSDYCIRRYFRGQYHTVESLLTRVDSLPDDAQTLPEEDGLVLYVTPSNEGEIARATEIAEGIRHPSVLTVIPRQAMELLDTALEVHALLQMESDPELVESDPLVLSEIQQMLDDARGHLQRLLDGLTSPASQNVVWYREGTVIEVRSRAQLETILSAIMATVYPLTPRINNEMLVRHRLPSALVNSRKKLLLGVLERSGRPELGIEGNFPDMAMFRTALLHTGLYREERASNRWRYARVKEIADPGMKEVWKVTKDFFTKPQQAPKPLKAYLDTLKAPPFGVRAAVLPILLGVGFRAFPGAHALTRDGEYVDDLLPSIVEEACAEPERYALQVLRLDKNKEAYLRALRELFAPTRTGRVGQHDLIRQCYDALEAWKHALPPAALSTRGLSERTQAFQQLLQSRTNPVYLLMEGIPEVVGESIKDERVLLEGIASCKTELEGTVARYRELAAETLRRAVAPGARSKEEDLRAMAGRWANCLTNGSVDGLADGVAKGFVSRIRIPYDSDGKLLDSLSTLLVGKNLTRWDDSTAIQFERKTHEVVHLVEEAALSGNHALAPDNGSVDALAELVRGRMEEQYSRLVTMVGKRKAKAILDTITKG